jgi:glycosyltransferase involved in cell wall biosynthesis
LADTVNAWSRDTHYDRVVAFCSSMRPYLDLPGLAEVPALVDLVDVDSQKWFDYASGARGLKRRLFALEGHRVRELEADLARRAEALLVVSQPEADLLRGFAPAANVHPIANGVDLDYFQHEDSGFRVQGSEEEIQNLVFVGALDYRANIDGITWFCREVWPRIHRRDHRRHHAPHGEQSENLHHAEHDAYGTPTLTLVGRNPVPAVRRLAELPGINLVGQVPDVRPYLSAATISIAPLRVARGIQNKVLEAAAMRKPIIASGPALEGLDFVPDKHVLRADTPAEWVAAISRLLSDASERERLAAAAHAFVTEHHSWSARLAPLADLLADRSRHRVPASGWRAVAASPTDPHRELRRQCHPLPEL